MSIHDLQNIINEAQSHDNIDDEADNLQIDNDYKEMSINSDFTKNHL